MRETAAVITEIKPGRGRVEVRPAGSGDWRAARPLVALRATEDATAVVLFPSGRGTVRVDRAGSPFTVPGPPVGEGKA